MLKLFFICFATFVTFECSKAEVRKDVHHPNVIIMHAKNLDWEDIGIHVNGNSVTPNIDYLAYSGIILNRFYANGGLESLLSGCYKRSKYANNNLVNLFFERNGYDVHFIARLNFDKIETFEQRLLDVITSNNKPFLSVIDFGSVGNGVHMAVIDKIVASLVKTAHEAEVIDNTIILFLSLPDNDDTSLESNVRRTAFVYSQRLKIQQSVSTQLIHLIDLLPTLASAAILEWNTEDVIDGIDLWSALNNNDEKRTEIFGDDFYINGSWKLSYGDNRDTMTLRYLLEKADSSHHVSQSSEAYVKAVMQSDVHEALNTLSPRMISVLKNRARAHCSIYELENINVRDISCSRANPCLFDLNEDPCELDNKFGPEFTSRRQQMKEKFENYLQESQLGIISRRSLATKSEDGIDDGTMVGIVLGATIGCCIITFIIVVCVKEKCIKKRSVYYDKSQGKQAKPGRVLRSQSSIEKSSHDNPISVISRDV